VFKLRILSMYDIIFMVSW